jgi:hypothetical protein
MHSLHQYAEVYPQNCSFSLDSPLKTKSTDGKDNVESDNYGLLFEDAFLCLTLLSFALKMVF